MVYTGGKRHNNKPHSLESEQGQLERRETFKSLQTAVGYWNDCAPGWTMSTYKDYLSLVLD